MKHPFDLHQGRRRARGFARRPRLWRRPEGAILLAVLAGGAIGTFAARLAEVPVDRPAALADSAAPADVAFGFCHAGGGRDCVVDGDTFRMGGIRIRIADIDTPETHPARCPEEARRGAAATRRLHALLNAGPVELHAGARDADRYGRKLRTVTVAGRGVGETLVAEGLARHYTGGYRPGWCSE